MPGDTAVTLLLPLTQPVGLSSTELKSRLAELDESLAALPLSGGGEHVRPADAARLDLAGTPMTGWIPPGFAGVTVLRFDGAGQLHELLDDPAFDAWGDVQEALFGEHPRAQLARGNFALGKPVVMIEDFASGTSPVRMLAFMRRGSGLTREAFLHEWGSYARSNFVASEEITCHLDYYTQHQALTDDDIALRGYDAIADVGFRDESDVVPWFHALAGLGPSQGIFGDDQQFFLVKPGS
jgi:hypothetical protein